MNAKAPMVAFGAGGQTNLDPAILVAMFLAIVLILFLPRKYVIIPLLFLSLPIPSAQMLMVGGFHFQLFRILVFFAWIRMIWQRYVKEGKASEIHFNAADMCVIWYAVIYVLAFTLLWREQQAFFDSIGKLYNIIGFYFAFRFFIRDKEDIERAIKALAVVALFIAACMWNEQRTGRNVLAMFGGVPAHTVIRGDYLRSQGPFGVYLTAGCFGSTLIPLFLCLWRKSGSRIVAGVGVIAGLVITFTSHTSTAVSACVAIVIGLAMWPLREKMQWVRRGLVVMVIGLQLVMKAPVWALISRIDLVGGSTGYQRFEIIDQCIRHFWSWWLVGARDYWAWGSEDDMWDQANQYVAIANTSGLLCLIFFLATIVYCFKYLGNARKAAGEKSSKAWFFWLLGVALFANLVAFLGISYFDQTFITWYALIAMIIAATGAPQQSLAVELERAPGSFPRKAQELAFGGVGRSGQLTGPIQPNSSRLARPKGWLSGISPNKGR
jgi:hypothetical protein